MANEIFISYRRSDAGWAGRLYDRLEKEFESEGVFIDVKGIEPGRDFDTTIRRQAENAKVMLAVIGDKWASGNEFERLESPEDYVRRELEIGLRRKGRVIPVLVEPSPDLTAATLPETLRDLATIQASKITHQAFRSDVEALIDVIKTKLDEMAAGGRRTWDRSLFLNSAHDRNPSLEKRLQEVLAWVERKGHTVRWGNGAKYGSANITPKGGSSTAMSADTTGLIFLFMTNLQQMGVLKTDHDREAFVDRLNETQGVGIRKDRIMQNFVSFQIRNIEQADIGVLLGVMDVWLAKRA